MGDENARTDRLSVEDLQAHKERLRDQAAAKSTSLLIYTRDGVKVVPLSQGEGVVIGRGPPADVWLRDPGLSRQHACVELDGGDVWVEDMGSTNGTWVNGNRVDRMRVGLEDELLLGTVAAAVHVTTPAQLRRLGIESHDQFLRDLEAEVHRCRVFSRTLALALVRCRGGAAHRPDRWLPEFLGQLRPYDRAALYSGDTVELLLPEVELEQARSLLQRALDRSPLPLRCGLGLLPVHAGSAGELLEVTRRAMQEATAARPVGLPPSSVNGSVRAPGGADQGPVATSAAMQEVLATAERLARAMIPVVILGETGVGKEVVARAIHERGPRGSRPMICINCGAIPEHLVESTLFGHEKGAFSGASQRNKGVFEAADGGTVLLDEVGELPPPVQAALLRTLENRCITRVGSSKEIPVDVRVLAATHQDLEAMCARGAFRKDLLFRLNTMTLPVPPLRERPDEIEPLAAHFIARAREAGETTVDGIDEPALELMRRHAWPGNVRELRNAIERAAVIATGDVITVEDLPDQVRELGPRLEHQAKPDAAPPASEGGPSDSGAAAVVWPEGVEDIDLRGELDRVETRLILHALDLSRWRRQEAAHRLGLPLRTLSNRMSRHGISRKGEPADE